MTTMLTMRSFSNVSYDHLRMDRIAFTAAMPLFAMSSLLIGRLPLRHNHKIRQAITFLL